MRADKKLAFKLRKQGKSYNEICKELGMSKSTLTNWFKGVDFSEDIKRNLTKQVTKASTIRLQKLNKARGDTLSALYARAELEAQKELAKYKNNPIFVSAIAAYWGEGDKLTKNQLRLTNTDPKMIELFRIFLEKFCDVNESNIRGAMFIYPDLDEERCRKFWTKNTGVKHFHKTMVPTK